MKTYRKNKSVLGQAFGICKGTSELGNFAGSEYMR